MQYPDAQIIALGEPLLQAIVCREASPKVRDYWGYTLDWKSGSTGPFSHLHLAENILGRVVFPFPHQPSLLKQFYRDRLSAYIGYMRESM